MALSEPFPDLDEIIASIGAGGGHVAAIDASEGAAGNISVCIGWPVEVRRRFPIVEEMQLPQPAPHLAGHVVIVTGSGRRLREIQVDPVANLGVVRINADGTTGTLHTAPTRLFEPSGIRTSRSTTTRSRGPARTSTPSSTPSRRA